MHPLLYFAKVDGGAATSGLPFQFFPEGGRHQVGGNGDEDGVGGNTTLVSNFWQLGNYRFPAWLAFIAVHDQGKPPLDELPNRLGFLL
ncbi:hypothetical protein HZU67_00001 [Apis mellifera carnica]|nr:hypothetical protein HZU67_00001 [Apis mellifera carnica]